MKEIPLTRGLVALVDDEDFDRVSRHKWCASIRTDGIYAVSRIAGRIVYLHRFIMDAPAGTFVDHENGNGLDCQRSSNLRFASRQQNAQNARKRVKVSGRPATSAFKGVIFLGRGHRPWQAQFSSAAGRTSKTFKTETEAARWWNATAATVQGEFARLNVLETAP